MRGYIKHDMTPREEAMIEEEILERLIDVFSREVYEQSCFSMLGGDVGMVYWRDLDDGQKASYRETSRSLILEALKP